MRLGWAAIGEEIRANAWLSAPVELGIDLRIAFESRWLAAGGFSVELSRISPIGGNA